MDGNAFLIFCVELEHYVDIDVIGSVPKFSIEQVVAKMFDFKLRNRSRRHCHENFSILKIESCCENRHLAHKKETEREDRSLQIL